MTTPILNFTGRDFSAEFERLLLLLRAALPEYTDLNPSDAGRRLVELLGRQTDLLNLYIDRAAQEGFIPVAIHKKSLIQTGRTTDYLPTLASPASTQLRLTRIDGVTGAIPIPALSMFTRSDGLGYCTTEDATIPSNEDTVDVDALQGVVVTDTLQAADFSIIDWTGRPRHNLGVGAVNALVSLTHATDPVTTWVAVDSFWRSLVDDYHYLLELDGDDETVWLTLGDGTYGVGTQAEDMGLSYLRTAGASGNCGTGVITGVPDALSEYVTCTNISQATGGAAPETTESIRAMIPRMARTQRRGLTTEDYETLISHIPGVLHCQAIGRNSSTDWPYLYVALFVVPDGGGPMSEYLRGLILAECASWGHLGDWTPRYILDDATETPVNVVARIGVLAGYNSNTVRANVISALTTALGPENQTVGGALNFMALHTAASAVAGVSWAEFDYPTASLTGVDGTIYTAGTIGVTVSA